MSFAGRTARVMLLLFLIAPSFAQTKNPIRDSQAVSWIQASLTALGGQTAITQVTSTLVNGSVAPAKGSNTPAGTFVWEDEVGSTGREFRYQFTSNGTTSEFVSGHGQPAHVVGTNGKKASPHLIPATLSIHLPGVLLNKPLSDTTFALHLVGTTTINGVPVIHVAITNGSTPLLKQIAQQDWYINSATGLPVRVEYRLPDSVYSSQFRTASADFANFQPVNGVLIPFQITASEEQQPVSVVTLSSVQFNVSFPSTDFDVPAGVK